MSLARRSTTSRLKRPEDFVPAASLAVLVADGDERIHEAARAALADLQVVGRSVEIRHARTAEEAAAAIEGCAVAVLAADLGATALLREVREERGDDDMRILIRITDDAPAALPGEAFIDRWGVDGLIRADDVGNRHLYAALRSALRAHVDAVAMQRQTEGLALIAKHMADARSRPLLIGFLKSLVEEIAASCWTHDYLCVPFLTDLDGPDPVIVSGGRFANAKPPNPSPREIVRGLREALEASDDLVVPTADDRSVFRLMHPRSRSVMGVLLIGSTGPVPPRVRTLVEQLGRDLAVARDNMELAIRAKREKELAQEVYNDRMALLGRLAASLAHEMNTPLGVAVHAGSLLREYDAALRAALAKAPEELAAEVAEVLEDFGEALELVSRNVDAAAGLVSSFKSMAVDGAADRERTFDPDEVVASAITSLSVLLRKKGQRVALAERARGLTLTGKPGWLSQVVNNLVLNASTHAYEDGPGEVAVRMRAADGQLLLIVEDRGKGMDAQTAARVFDPFVTLAASRGGSGLGMSIVHQLVTVQLHGTIALDTAPGEGARFTVRLPIAPAAADGAVASPESTA